MFLSSQDEYNLNPGLEWEDEFTGRWLFRLALTDIILLSSTSVTYFAYVHPVTLCVFFFASRFLELVWWLLIYGVASLLVYNWNDQHDFSLV